MSSNDNSKTELPPQYNTIDYQQPPVSYLPPAGYPPYSTNINNGQQIPPAGYPPYNTTVNGSTTVVMPSQPAPLSNPPKDYLPLSIVTTFCCCFFIGIFAIIKSQATRAAINSGNGREAEANSHQAKIYNIINICVGLVVWAGVIGYTVWANTYVYSLYD